MDLKAINHRNEMRRLTSLGLVLIPLLVPTPLSANCFHLRLWGVLATRSSRKFPVELTEIANHNHWYYDRGPKINESVWEFLKKQSLTADPHYEQYRFNN